MPISGCILRTVISFAKAKRGSNEYCKMTALTSQVTIYAEVWTEKSYSGLAITCTISEDHVSLLALTDGQPLSSQSGEVNSTQLYLLTVPGGHSVECVTSCDNGNADLKLRFGDPALLDTCYSGSNSSNEVCNAAAPYRPDDYLVDDDFVNTTTLYAEVYSVGKYSNLTITCTISEGLPSIALVDGKRLDGQHGAHHTSTFYSLNIPAGHSVECETSCDNGDADLYLFFDDSEGWEEYVSHSDSYEVCSATAPADENTMLHAEVHAYGEYSNLNIRCTTKSPPVPTARPSPQPTEPNCQASGLFSGQCK
jgi:hypothetical protein